MGRELEQSAQAGTRVSGWYRQMLWALALIGFVAGMALQSGANLALAQATKGATKGTSKKGAVKVAKGPNAAPSGKLPAPTVTVILKSAGEAFDDVDHIFKLANSPDQSKTLTETLSLFLEGVDRQRPVFAQGFLAGTDLKFVFALPMASTKELKLFLKNMNDLDLTNKAVVGTPNLYEVGGLIEQGAFIRYDETLKYAIIAEWKEEANAYKTLPDIKLLGSNDVVVLIENTKEQAAERKNVFGRLRKEGVDALKRGADESQAAFDVRKKAAIHQLDEIERYFVESEKIRIGWTLDTARSQASVNIDLTPLAGTPLAESVALIGKHPNRFAKLSAEGAVVVVDTNFPLDEMHKTQLLEQTPLTVTAIHDEVEKNAKLSAAEKQAGKELATLGGEIASGLAQVGVVNGALRVYPGSSGSFVSIGSGSIEDGAKFTEFLKKGAERLGSDALTPDVDAEGDVKIHKLSFAAYQKDFPELLAADGMVYVGVGANQVWVGSGEGALPRLKEAIKGASAEPTTNDIAISIAGNLLPWAKILDRQQAKEKIGDAALRKMALEAFSAGGDTWTLKLWRDDKQAKVQVELNEGVLRLGGKVGAKFVKESLE